MTSERLLLGRSKTVRLKSNDFFSDIDPRRTSKPEKLSGRIFRADCNDCLGYALATSA